jgi:hypothetical protein
MIEQLKLLDQEVKVMIGEVNTALAENRKTTELLTKMTQLGLKVMNERLEALEKFAADVRSILDVELRVQSQRLDALEKAQNPEPKNEEGKEL